MRCRAHECPETGLFDERVFCNWHWDLLAAEAPGYQEWLCDAYATITWRKVLCEVVLKLREIEARLGMPW